MTLDEFVANCVKKAYWDDDIPCSPTTLRILGELFGLKIGEQVYTACWGLNGAGKYGAQCGLVEGTIMFIGLMAHREDLEKEKMSEACFDFAKNYEHKFGSLRCKELRPGGFKDDDPPQLCEPLTVNSIVFSARFISDWFSIRMKPNELKFAEKPG